MRMERMRVRKIAFWETLGDSYHFVLGDVMRFLGVAGAWIAMSAALAFAFGLYARFAGMPRNPVALSHVSLALLLMLGLGFLRLVTLTGFAVSWHRAILLADVPRGFAFRFGRREMRYFFYGWGLMLTVALVLAVLAFAAAAILGLLFGISGLIESAPQAAIRALTFAIPALFGMIIFIAIGLRIVLGLPAIAVDEPRGVLRRSWDRSAGNGWRLFFAALLCLLPMGIIAGAVNSVAPMILRQPGTGRAVAGVVALAIGTVLFYFLLFLGDAVWVAFLSNAYRQLAAPKPERGALLLGPASAAS
jgi:hypothetical protein